MPERERDDIQSLLMEIRERLASMETKLESYTKIEDTAMEAYNIAKQNERDIQELRSTLAKVTYTAVTAILIPIATWLLGQCCKLP